MELAGDLGSRPGFVTVCPRPPILPLKNEVWDLSISKFHVRSLNQGLEPPDAQGCLPSICNFVGL